MNDALHRGEALLSCALSYASDAQAELLLPEGIEVVVVQDLCEVIPPERVWHTASQALAAPLPHRFLQALRNWGALAVLFPEIDALFGVTQPPEHHPEIDTGVHCLMVLQQAALMTPSSAVRFAALTHDLGKALTPPALWPQHHGHEARGLRPLRTLCRRYSVSPAWQRLALLVCRYHTHSHRALELRPKTLYKVLKATGGLRNSGRFEQFLTACEADSRGRPGYEQTPYPQADYLRGAHTAASASSPTGSSRAARQRLQRDQLQRLHEYRSCA